MPIRPITTNATPKGVARFRRVQRYPYRSPCPLSSYESSFGLRTGPPEAVTLPASFPADDQNITGPDRTGQVSKQDKTDMIGVMYLTLRRLDNGCRSMVGPKHGMTSDRSGDRTGIPRDRA